MSLHLSATDVARLEHAVHELLTPLADEPPAAWRPRIARSVGALLGADQAVVCLEVDGTSSFYHGEGAWLDGALRDYGAYYHQLDVGLWERRRALGLEVFHRDDLYDRRTFVRTELYNDWGIPYRIMDVLAMGFAMDGALPFASVHVCHDRDMDPGFGERGRQLFRLLLPAFKAGVQTFRRYAACRAELLRVLDRLPQGVRLLDGTGQRLHENAALVRLLAAEPVRTSLERALLAAGRAAVGQLASRRAAAPGSAMPVYRDLVVGPARYHIAASLLPDAGLGQPAALISVECAVSAPPSDAALRMRHGLTPRESAVARRVAAGQSSAALATELGISRHTARRHTERVLQKLGVHSRAGVGAALAGSLAAAPAAPSTAS